MLRNRLWHLPLGAGAVYLVLLGARLHGLVTAMHWISDSSGCFTLAQAVADGHAGGDVVLTTYGLYVPLWFGLATAHLPFHRELWEIAPYLAYIAAAAIVAWSVSRVSSARSAMLAGVIMVAASPGTLYVVVRVSHHPAYVGTALLGAYAIWAFEARPRSAASVAVVVAGAVAIGTLVASDALLVFTGLAPLTLLALAAAPQQRAAAAWCGAMVAGAAAAALATSTIMHALHFRTLPREVRLAAPSAAIDHVGWLADGLVRLGNGAAAGVAIPGRPPLNVLAVVLVIVGLALAVAVYLSTAVAVGRTQLRAASPRDAHLLFWGTSALTTIGAFVASTSALEGGDQYYVTVIFSVAALAPLARLGWSFSPAAGAVAVAAFALLSAVGVGAGDTERLSRLPVVRAGGSLVAFAEQQGVTVGYAGWWDAPNLTWNSSGAVDVRPIYGCSNPGGADLCPFYLMRVRGWYQPRPQRTFLLVDPATGYVTRRPPELGEPSATFSAGGINMYVYPYDIASRLGAPTN